MGMAHEVQAGGTTTAFSGTQTAFPGTQTAFPGTQTAYPGQSGTETAYPGMVSGMATAYPGMSTVNGGELNLGEIGHARKTMMGAKLDAMADSVSGQTVVDAKGYLTDLNGLMPKNLGNIGDIKRGRILLKSVRETNPKHPPAWIASAMLEKVSGKLQQARNIIIKGTEVNPDSEEIWEEAIKLVAPAQQKSLAAQAVNAIPNSVALWIQACGLESDKKSKRAVLRKALVTVPDSVELWKAAVDLEEPEDAKVLLEHASIHAAHAIRSPSVLCAFDPARAYAGAVLQRRGPGTPSCILSVIPSMLTDVCVIVMTPFSHIRPRSSARNLSSSGLRWLTWRRCQMHGKSSTEHGGQCQPTVQFGLLLPGSRSQQATRKTSKS